MKAALVATVDGEREKDDGFGNVCPELRQLELGLG